MNHKHLSQLLHVLISIQNTPITLQAYARHIREHVKIMPDAVADAERFSTLHSWYKHLGNFEIIYPILMQGEQPRYDFDTSYSDLNQKELPLAIHFQKQFILLSFELRRYRGTAANPKDIITFMKQYPIYVSRKMGYGDVADFQIQLCTHLAKAFWNGIQNMASETQT